MRLPFCRQALCAAAALPILAACGGGGSGGGSSFTPSVVSPPVTPPSSSTPDVPDFVANQYPPSSELKNLCAVVRTDRDPDGNRRPDQQGELGHELFWVRSWMDETYLYFDRVVDTDPTGFTDVEAYFDERLTTATSAANRPVDRFSYTQPTEDFEVRREGGPVFTYGAEFARLATNTLPRDWRVSFTQAGSPAEAAGFTRGARIIAVDGEDFLRGTGSTEIDTIVAGLFPESEGETHVITVERPDGTQEDLTLTSASLTIEPVNLFTTLDAGDRRVGYMHYYTFSPFTGERQLLDTFTEFSAQGVDDVVLDLRYNGGGLLALAAQLGYMVAGPGSEDEVFYSQQFNSRDPNRDPVSGRRVDPIPFINETIDFSVPPGQRLPSVDLPRVFVLTTGRSCSASEAVMNGLSGIGVEVIQIGERTCGKSTGQIPVENCGITFAPLHFRGVNARGFGDFDDGFAPNTPTGFAQVTFAGCEVEDDFTRDLGDPEEAMLGAALQYAQDGTCPAVNTQKPRLAAQQALSIGERDPLVEHPRVRALDAGFGELVLPDTGE